MADVSISSGGTLASAFRTVGRARAFYSLYWDGTADLALTHLGDTEGDQKVDAKSEITKLTLPELTGPATVKAWEQGADPEATIPLFLADPAKRSILTPVGGSGGVGRSSRRAVKEYTLVLLPEEIFRKADGTIGSAVTFAKVGGVWKLDGVAFTTEQNRLLDMSVWLWRGYFMRPPITFKHADGGKTVDTVTFAVMQDFTKPEGEQLFTVGDPADVGIDIDPVA